MLLTDGLQRLCSMLKIPQHAAEDALQSERLAQHVVGRRGFMVGGLALLSSGVAYGLPLQKELGTMVMTDMATMARQRYEFPVDLSQPTLKSGTLPGVYMYHAVDVVDSLGRNVLGQTFDTLGRNVLGQAFRIKHELNYDENTSTLILTKIREW